MSYSSEKIGTKQGLKFNQFAAQEFSLNYTRHEKLATDSPELFFLYNIFHSGLSGNCKAKGEEIDFTFFDVINWVDDLYDSRNEKTIQAVVNVFKSSRLWEDMVETTKEAGKKKDAKSPPIKKSKSTGRA